MPVNDPHDLVRIAACLDTNVLISALLAPGLPGVSGRLVRLGLQRRFILVISEVTLQELVAKTQRKPTLAKRISPKAVDELVELIRLSADVIPARIGPYIPITRDVRDDFLLDPAIRAQADYIVSGDKDLQVLGEVEGVKILSPAAFLALLNEATNESP